MNNVESIEDFVENENKTKLLINQVSDEIGLFYFVLTIGKLVQEVSKCFFRYCFNTFKECIEMVPSKVKVDNN